jgi:acyl-CoA dehydrogenase
MRGSEEQLVSTGWLTSAVPASSNAGQGLERTAWTIGTDVAAPAANDVDRESRFPAESLEAFRESRLLSALIPENLGGGGASLAEVAGAVRALAFHCAASALVLAMHSIEVSNLIRHGTTEPLQALLGEIAEKQLLIANANSEIGGGGDVGRSICALEPTDGGLHLEKHALAISYGEYADLIVATARSGPESADTDQQFVVCRKSDLTLEPTSTWDAMGLRGTCSMSFKLVAEIDPALIYPVAFSLVASNGGGQATMILLSSVWVGLADAAAAKAHAHVRAAARRSPDVPPPTALRLAELLSELEQARAVLAISAARFDAADEVGEMESVAFISSLRGLKVSTSTLAVSVATAALEICGIAGYRRDTPVSLDRHLRDAFGGLVMVGNDRYLHNNAQLLLARKQL